MQDTAAAQAAPAVRDHDVASALALLEERGVDTLIVAGCDTHGIMRGKRIPVGEARGALTDGINLCNVMWVIDVAESDFVPRPGDVRGYFPTERNGYPDVRLVPDLATLRVVPWHENTALVLGDFTTPHGDPVPIAPRTVLSRLVERAQTLGLEPQTAIELEFYVLRETPETLAGKTAAQLVPYSLRPSTYGVVTASSQEPFTRAVRDGMRAFEVPVEACNPETGPGQFEINLRHAEARTAADHAFLFKSAIKELAARMGLTATFMAKPHPAWSGNSCHIHMSMLREGRNAFAADDDAPGAMSATMRSAAAGIIATLGELTALLAPTINSYRRFRPYSWGGTTATWGIDNRTVGVRAVCESSAATRLEHRQGGGDANPYLVSAAMLAGALHGIENQLEPPALRDDDVYALPPGAVETAPDSLAQATEALHRSSVARAYLGDDFVDHYVAMQRAEVAAANEAVTDWEIDRYLESV